MKIILIGLFLLSGFGQANQSLLEVRIGEKSLTVLKNPYFKPVALMENSIIVETEESGIENLRNIDIDFKVLLDPTSLKQAKDQNLSFYLVTPPFERKSESVRIFLEQNGRVLTEDNYSYLFLTSPDFAERLPILRYEIAHVSLKGIVLSEDDIGKPSLQETAWHQPNLNPIIDSIINQITPTEVAQLVRELSGEVPVLVWGRLDTILTRYATAPKNSDAIWYCYENLSSFAGLDTIEFHPFTWQSSRNDSNVIATKVGTVYPGRYWIIGGHIDCTSENPTVYAPGADDNATGTAAMMIAAKYLSPLYFKNTIRFIAWNTEEFGLYGSEAHALEARSRNDTILGVLNGDMIGTEFTNNDSIRIYTGPRTSSRAIGDSFFNVNADYGIGLNIRRSSYMPSYSDHYSYYTQDFDAVCIIEDDNCPYYHTTGDRITASSFDTLFFCKVVKNMVATLATFAEIDTIGPGIGGDVAERSFKNLVIKPNPTRGLATVFYNLPKQETATLKIYDVLGDLVYSEKSDKGLFRIEKLPAGIYVLRFEANGYKENRKLAVVK